MILDVTINYAYKKRLLNGGLEVTDELVLGKTAKIRKFSRKVYAMVGVDNGIFMKVANQNNYTYTNRNDSYYRPKGMLAAVARKLGGGDVKLKKGENIGLNLGDSIVIKKGKDEVVFKVTIL